MNKLVLAAAIAAFAAGCAQMEVGSSEAKTTATGSAGGANSQNANKSLERCAETLGTVTIEEDQTQPWFFSLQQHQLGPTTPVLKMLLQQSNCFVVVDRGRAMRNMQQERELAASGELRKNSKMHKGQMVAADYIVEPSVTFSNNNAGGLGGAIGGTFGGSLGAVIGGSMSSKEASTMLTLIDARSGVQLAAAEGSARNMDFGAIGGLFGAYGGAGMGGYSNTAQGKVVVAAFTDSINNLIKAVKDYKAQEVKGGLGTGGHLKVN